MTGPRRPERAPARGLRDGRATTRRLAARRWAGLVGAVLLGAVLLGLPLAGCGQGQVQSGGRGSGPATASPQPAATELSRAKVRLLEVARLGAPVAMATRAGDPALYVAEQAGRVRRLVGGRVESEPVLDITGLVKSGGEQGLLGIAFAPDGRHVYLDYTDTGGDTRIVEYAVADGRVDAATRRELLYIQQPYANHNGGQLAFGPDGDLYIGMGDGGGAGDPQDNGQSLRSLLGKILRISPTPAAGRPYGIPADNPFAGRSDARPEIWSYGLRNPWRFSFDPANGDLWIGDVGQNVWEEVDRQAGGAGGGQNYGWNRLEGNHPFRGQAPAGAVPPVLEYDHRGGACTVIGGSVYRGAALPALRGAYVYGDYCAGWIAAVSVTGGAVSQPHDLGVNVPSLSTFGVDQGGELYAMSVSGPVYRIVAG